jgi:hypothetical protein
MLTILQAHASNRERDSIEDRIPRSMFQNFDAILDNRIQRGEPIMELNENGFLSDSEEIFDYDSAIRNENV